MNNFTIKETPIKDLVIIEPKVFGDERGFFMETYNQKSFEELGLTMNFVFFRNCQFIGIYSKFFKFPVDI